MRNQVRTFVAVNLSPSVRQSVSKLIRQLEPQIEGTRWVEAENLHVTLKFLGDIPLTELPQVIESVRRGAANVETFDLGFVGCGAFPNLSNPKTIWIGCQQGSGELTELAAAIENELLKVGFPKEQRRFSPHLTIGRVKRSDETGDELAEFFRSKQNQPFGSSGIDEVIVYSSELTRQGPVYDELATVPLK